MLTTAALASTSGGVQLLRQAQAATIIQTITQPAGETLFLDSGPNGFLNGAGVALRVSDIQFFGSCAADGNESDDPDCALGEILEDGDRCQIEVTCNVANGSDIRLKTDISRIGVADNGLPLYRFRYKTGSQYYQGVMAQDVLDFMPEAVLRNEEGYYLVRYDMLGLTMRRVD